mgnify:FL=1
MKPNHKFELSVNDMKIIETALQNKLSRRAERLMQGEDAEILQTEAKEIRELLGRLHNQKNWYRPSKGIYVSG